MPFDPLPKILITDLENLAHAAVDDAWDLGCGDGRLGRRLRQYGVRVWGLDRHRELGAFPDVVADVRALPVAAGRAGLVLAANLVRHLLPHDPAGDFLLHWFSALRSGGVLYILEDAPDCETPARKNYHDLQELLVRIAGPERGPLLTPAHFQAIAGKLPSAAGLRWGTGSNLQRPDPEVVLSMLAGCAGRPSGSVGRLMRAIKRHGLAYGDFWWLRVSREGD